MRKLGLEPGRARPRATTRRQATTAATGSTSTTAGSTGSTGATGAPTARPRPRRRRAPWARRSSASSSPESTLTFIATYKITSSSATDKLTSLTIAQQSPNQLFKAVTSTGTFEFLTIGTKSYLCSQTASKWICLNGGKSLPEADLFAVYEPGTYLPLVQAAAKDGAHASYSSKTVNGFPLSVRHGDRCDRPRRAPGPSASPPRASSAMSRIPATALRQRQLRDHELLGEACRASDFTLPAKPTRPLSGDRVSADRRRLTGPRRPTCGAGCERQVANDEPVGFAPMAIDTTDASFEGDVLVRSDTVPVVVDLWAPWCGPCKTLGPIIERVVEATGGAVELVKVNVDENPEDRSELPGPVDPGRLRDQRAGRSSTGSSARSPSRPSGSS